MINLSKNLYLSNFACFIAMLMWSLGFPAGEQLLESWGVLSLTFIRLFIGVMFLILIWILVEGFKSLNNPYWLYGIFIGGIGWGFGAILLLLGQKLSDPVTPTICAAMMPIFGAIVEIIFDKRKININLILGIILAVWGGYLATGVKFEQAGFGLGALLCIISVILFAWCTRATTIELKNLTAIGQTTITFTGSLICVALIYFISILFFQEEIDIGIIDKYHISLLLIFTLISLTISQAIWLWGARRLGILLASFHSNLVPFYVMIIMVVAFKDIWIWTQALGAFLVGLGVIVAQYKIKKL